MKIRIFKYASEIRKIFLRSGTSGRTGNTVGKKPDYKRLGRFGRIVEDLNNMSVDEFRQALMAAGIVGADGKLLPTYTRGTQKQTVQ